MSGEHDSEPTVRVRLDLAYDGTAFSGWARQPDLRTVQGVIEEALQQVLRLDSPPRLTVAGRTDAGVHARGQVAHLDIPQSSWQRLPGRSDRDPANALVHRLMGLLARGSQPRGSSDVVIHHAEPVPADFDARFAALWRRYAYVVADATAPRDPLTRGHVLWYPRALDAASMDVAAGALLGQQDFAAFCKPREGATTRRTLFDFTWERLTPEEGGLLVGHVKADAFCHSMVRFLVGACLAVGEGRRAVSWPASLLATGERDPALQVAPAHGLMLMAVAYPEPEQLAVRVAEARQRRDEPGD